MDADLEQMTRDQLIAEAKKLREGIREQRTRVILASPRIVGLVAGKDGPYSGRTGMARVH